MNRTGGLAIAAALVAAAASETVQLLVAAVALGIVGMAHGAGDLAVVAPERRPAFLTLYVAVGGGALLWWIGHPAAALPVFLAASAIHFGMEDAPDGGWVERAARGIGLIAAPAVLHPAGYGAILDRAGGEAAYLPDLVALMGGAGMVAAAWLAATAIVRRDGRLLAGTLALVALPPLVGFSVAFLLLHAEPQTRERRDALGFASTADYLRATAPVLLAAVAIAGAVALLLLRWDASGTRSLFAAVAALAMPHLLVTPWFERGSRRFPVTAAGTCPRSS